MSQTEPHILYLLRYTFSDGCTYTSTETIGVFSTKELAEEAKEPWLSRHNVTPGGECNWDDIEEIQIDVPID